MLPIILTNKIIDKYTCIKAWSTDHISKFLSHCPFLCSSRNVKEEQLCGITSNIMVGIFSDIDSGSFMF